MAQRAFGDHRPGRGFHFVELANTGQHQMAASRIGILGFVKLPPAVRPAAHFDDAAGNEQVIVSDTGLKALAPLKKLTTLYLHVRSKGGRIPLERPDLERVGDASLRAPLATSTPNRSSNADDIHLMANVSF